MSKRGRRVRARGERCAYCEHGRSEHGGRGCLRKGTGVQRDQDGALIRRVVLGCNCKAFVAHAAAEAQP